MHTHLAVLYFLLFFDVISAQYSSVAEIPAQPPMDGRRRHPDFVYYHLTFSDDVRTTEKTCGNVLQPYYVTFQAIEATYNSRGVVLQGSDRQQIPLKPLSELDADTSRIASCNPFQDNGCDICVKNNRGRDADYVIYDGNRVIATIKCLYMEIIDCGKRYCLNGEYASSYVQFNSHGFVSSKTECLPCKRGTWLTCTTYATCSYDIPSSPGTFYSEQIYKLGDQEPVGSCYPCNTAGANKVHYGNTQKAVQITLSNDDPLPWYCPGGAEPPVSCKAPYVGSDKNHMFCVCAPGKYNVQTQDACATCAAGNMCMEGTMTECPDNYYQDKTGASSCVSCLTDVGNNLCQFNANNRNKMVKCVGPQKSQPPTCVECNACRHPYERSSAGVVDCY